MSEAGLLVIYSGPSGVGKGTVLKPYLQSHTNAVLSVSMTTRAPRPGEQDGVDYYFVTRKDFEQKLEENGFLEHAEYSGNYYGTPREPVERMVAEGRDVFLEIEVQGALQVKRAFPQATAVFILPPSYQVLCERLNRRGTEQPEIVGKRLAVARQELKMADQYEYIIVNDDIHTACEQLAAVVTAEKCRLRHMKPIIEKVCECK